MSIIATLEHASFYLSKKVYYTLFAASVIFVVSYFQPFLFDIAIVVLLLTLIAVLADVLLLYTTKAGINADRILSDRLSNGDDNWVTLFIDNQYGFKISTEIIDELPFQFEDRNWLRKKMIEANSTAEIKYSIKPLKRGEYHFGVINIYVSSL
jgi:uncharacterized protein (DUF58 family)